VDCGKFFFYKIKKYKVKRVEFITFQHDENQFLMLLRGERTKLKVCRLSRLKCCLWKEADFNTIIDLGKGNMNFIFTAC
jgi:hypothetical protein